MQESIIFSVHDMKVYELTALGDADTDPTYGTAVDVPGVNEVGLDPEISNAILRGDGRVIDSRSSLDQLTLSFQYAKLSPAVLAVIDGGTVQTGTGPSEGITRYVRESDDRLGRWAFAALISEVDNPGGAAKLYGYLCTASGGSLFGASDSEHGEPSFDATVIGIPKGAMWALDLEDTGTALPADGAALIATYGTLPTS
jgi:hypothetical protein